VLKHHDFVYRDDDFVYRDDAPFFFFFTFLFKRFCNLESLTASKNLNLIESLLNFQSVQSRYYIIMCSPLEFEEFFIRCMEQRRMKLVTSI
jgi:hypothetical protein